MKLHLFIFASFISVFLLTPLTLYAKDASTAAENRQIKQDSVEMKIDAKKEAFEDRKASIEAKTKQLKTEKVLLFWDHSKSKLLGTIERINLLIERLEGRIAKVAETDPSKDLTSVKAELERAKTLLASAKTKVEAIDTELPAVLTTTTPKTAFRNHISTLKTVKSELTQVHKILVKVIGQIKGLRVGNTVKLTKTPSITTSVTATLTPAPSATLTPAVTLTVTPTP